MNQHTHACESADVCLTNGRLYLNGWGGPYHTSPSAGDLGASAPALQEARARWEALGDPRLLGRTLFFLGVSALLQGNDEEAATLTAQALERYEAAGDAYLLGATRFWRAMIMVQLGNLPRAGQEVRAGLAVSLAFRSHWHLSIGALAALAILGERADLVRRARGGRPVRGHGRDGRVAQMP